MFAFQAMSESIDYIENNICEKLNVEDIASVACYSSFHYQRLFQMLTGYTLGEYIRNRRMTMASKELLTSDAKVIDLAYKYQYESPEAFTRAFKKLFQMTPTQLKKSKDPVKSYPRLSIQVQMTGRESLSYKIIEKDGFYIEGFKKSFTAEEIMEGKAYSKFWKEKETEIKDLLEKNNTFSRIGAGRYRDNNQGIYDAIIGTYGKGGTTLYVPKTRWCVFTGKGPISETLPLLWQRIFLEWFPKTSFQHSGMTELEIFPIGDISSSSYRYEIWIPLSSAILKK
ncbi:MAG: AraC family transcriptional regulator [Clostridiales bacterium]|nr:AraC family transcriptional regulator [Clostridiales bacterium]